MIDSFFLHTFHFRMFFFVLYNFIFNSVSHIYSQSMQITEKIILCQYHYKNVEPFSFLVLFLEALIGSIEYLKYKVLTCIKKKKKKKKI